MQINYEKFDKLTMGDPEFTRQLLAVYIQQFEEYLEEMKGHVAEHDLNKVRFLNHKIRSSVTVLDLNTLLEGQIAMNNAARDEEPGKIVRLYEQVEAEVHEVVTQLNARLVNMST
jgi:HPt (histidine-containing phosphotransfer) domain-containing protein